MMLLYFLQSKGDLVFFPPTLPFICGIEITIQNARSFTDISNEFKNFYSRRHDRIVNKIADFMKENRPRARISSNLLAETIFPEFEEEIKQIVHRKPDIVILNRIHRQCTIVEITVCYDLYLENAYQEKVRRYRELCDYLERNEFSVQLVVLCFGSLGCAKSDVWKGLSNFPHSKENIKNVECDEMVFHLV